MDKKSWFVPSGTKSAAFKKWWPREALLASLKQQEEEARKNAPPPVIHLTEEEAEIMVRDRREKGVVEGDWPRASQEFLDYWGINSTYSFPSSSPEVKLLVVEAAADEVGGSEQGQDEEPRPEWANSTLFSRFTPRMLNKKYWALEVPIECSLGLIADGMSSMTTCSGCSTGTTLNRATTWSGCKRRSSPR